MQWGKESAEGGIRRTEDVQRCGCMIPCIEPLYQSVQARHRRKKGTHGITVIGLQFLQAGTKQSRRQHDREAAPNASSPEEAQNCSPLNFNTQEALDRLPKVLHLRLHGRVAVLATDLLKREVRRDTIDRPASGKVHAELRLAAHRKAMAAAPSRNREERGTGVL